MALKAPHQTMQTTNTSTGPEQSQQKFLAKYQQPQLTPDQITLGSKHAVSMGASRNKDPYHRPPGQQYILKPNHSSQIWQQHSQQPHQPANPFNSMMQTNTHEMILLHDSDNRSPVGFHETP